MALTIYDIAKEAGVSITTVSRVLNHKGEVSPRTAAKIQAVLDAHQYAPSQIAKGLASNESRNVGIFALDLRVEHHALLVHRAEEALSEAGYSCIVCSLGGKPDRLRDCIRTLMLRRVDGVIFTGSVFATEAYSAVIAEMLTDVPSVIINAVLPQTNVRSVINDEEAAFEDAVRFLAREKGKSHIVLLGDAPTPSEEAKKRGYRSGMEQCGISSAAVHIPCGHSVEEGFSAAKKALSACPETDAFLCTVDSVAVGAVHALHEAGVSIPQQVAVIGADNSTSAEVCWPRLTSVDVHPCETASEAVRLLIAAMNGQGDEKCSRIDCSLVQREST